MIFARKSLLLALQKAGFPTPSFKTRRVFAFLFRQSELMAGGLDPYGDAIVTIPLSARVRPALTRRRTEFLTVIAAKNGA